MDEAQELELKLDADARITDPLRAGQIPDIPADKSAHEKLTAVYFDTKKRSLARKGLSLRIRTEGGRRIQTMKAQGPDAAGLFARPEWNVEVNGDEPSFLGIEDTSFSSLVSPQRLRDRLKPVFTTEVDRTTWRIRSKTAEIEMALDEGYVSADGRRQTFSEIELELKSGAPSELFRVARMLAGVGPLRIGVLTKSERGYVLAAPEAPSFFKSEPLALQPDASTADAFRLIVRVCLRHFRLNEPLLIENRRPEALHQARVALRRLRTALSLFKSVVSDEKLDQLKGRLRGMSQRLGEARDLDVMIANQDKPGEQQEGRHDAELAERLRRDREQAYDRVIETLQGDEFPRLLLDLLAWSEAGPWLSADDRRSRRDQPIANFAAEVLDRWRRRIKKTGRKLEDMTPPDRHRVRIDAKKLRYATEFFSSLAAGKKNQRRHRAFAQALEELQEHLGELNDLATGEKITTDLARETGGSREVIGGANASRAVGTHRGQARQIKKSLTSATRAFQDFAGTKPFWEQRSSSEGPKG